MSGQGKTVVVGEVEFIAQEGANPVPRVVLIRPGMSANRLKWTAPVIKAAVESGHFNGIKMFKDHNKRDPLARNMDDLVSAIDQTRVGAPGEKDGKGKSLEGAAIADIRWLNPAFATFANEAREHIGVSVVLPYQGDRGRDAQGPYIEPKKTHKAISVDWVPFPAVPGTGIIDYAQESFSMEWTDADIAELRKQRPDLFAQESQGDGSPVDVNAIAEAAAKKVADTIETAVEAAVRKTTDTIAQEAAERRETADKVAAYLKGVPLPQLTKDRIAAGFAGDREYKEDALKLAVESAQAEFAQAKLPGPKITGAGSTAAGVASEGASDQAVVSPGQEAAHDAAMRAFSRHIPAPAQKE